MVDSVTIQIAQRGVVTLPQELRQAYNLQTGDTLILLDLGDVFLLSPKHCEIDILAHSITQALVEKGETLETMLQTLREEREQDAL